ncbi:hypothetical protein JS530_07305 [Bifidobacterium sp. LC6]|uniref:Uncharacterized protein n=1 Tax=Bifidobacterium colobi TaxID=2809026 RepID=A0ABS5UXE3_9BIFI|nr:hypothetical protein [Bifidobacterium colobi]MBT1175306.1 hypothetical protein [Bifidobacterium colobi]
MSNDTSDDMNDDEAHGTRANAGGSNAAVSNADGANQHELKHAWEHEPQTIGDRIFTLLDDGLTKLKTMPIDTMVSDASQRAVRIAHAAVKPLTILAVLAVLVGVGVAGWTAGGYSVAVQNSPEYHRETEKLKWATSDLMESKQDVENRNRQIRQAQSQLDEIAQQRKQYGQIVSEIKQAQQQSEDPKITVTAIADYTKSFTYYTVPITVHNNTQDTLTRFTLYYQAVDGSGNVAHNGFAMGESGTTCAPNADCAIRIFDMYNPAGTKIIPVSWNVTTQSGESSNGRYGADVLSRQF